MTNRTASQANQIWTRGNRWRLLSTWWWPGFLIFITAIIIVVLSGCQYYEEKNEYVLSGDNSRVIMEGNAGTSAAEFSRGENAGGAGIPLDLSIPNPKVQVNAAGDQSGSTTTGE